MKAGLYCRISFDKVGAGLGVDRQRQDCEALAQRHGWEVVRVYTDNDVSAYSGRKRPEYRRLLEDMKAGLIEVVVAWHTDRLHRSPRELEEFIDICDAHKVRVETVQAGELDLKSASGRAVARTLGAWARYESEHKSDRITRANQELAKQGLPHLGGMRCYGYAKDKVTIVPEEAAVLREAADRALAGESLRSICADLNERGLPTAAGYKWSTVRMKELLIRPRMAALRAHHTLGVFPAKWPPIFTQDQHMRLVAFLTDPARRTNPGAPRRWLLSGILICGECGNKLSGQRPFGKPPKRAPKRMAQYRCAPQEHRGCGRIGISSHLIEPFVVEEVLTTIETARLDLGAGDTDGRADIDALAADKEQLAELASLYAGRSITAQEWLRARSEIESRIEEANHRLADQSVTQGLREFTAGGDGSIRDVWPTFSLERQRATIMSVLERVTVNRAKTTRFFDPTRLEPVWRV
jgi:site-specific DNA recombinase